MFNKIIVGMDLSSASLDALDQVMPIARASGAEIVMVFAGEMLDNSEHYPWISKGLMGHYREMIESEQAKTRARLEEIRQQHTGQGVTLSHSLHSGFAENALGHAAKELGADLIAVGSHGRTGFDHFLLGSVAERVSRFTEVDVLVARKRGSNRLYERILVPTDFSTAADRAVEVSAELAAPDAHLTLLHVWRLPGSIAGFSSSELASNVASGVHAELEATAEKIRTRRNDIVVTVAAVDGHAADAIHTRADDCDLVVMGSHGRRGIRRFLLGSVTEKVVRHAPCSVYVARERPA